MRKVPGECPLRHIDASPRPPFAAFMAFFQHQLMWSTRQFSGFPTIPDTRYPIPVIRDRPLVVGTCPPHEFSKYPLTLHTGSPFQTGRRPTSIQAANSNPDIDFGILTAGNMAMNSWEAEPAAGQLRSVKSAAPCDRLKRVANPVQGI